jgi:hypothetical protein
MLQKKNIDRVETHGIDSHIPKHLSHHLPRMREIYLSSFSAPEDDDISYLFKDRGDGTTLTLFFDKNNILGGFAISGIQQVNVDNRIYAVFSAGVYFDLNYRTGQSIARSTLKQSLKYKLKHPTHKLVFLGQMLSPAGYSLSARTFPTFYPHPFRKTPADTYKVLEAIIAFRQYTMVPGQKFIAKPPVACKIVKPERLYHSNLMNECVFYRHYFQLNPHFNEGAGLLIFIPLNLNNLFWGMFNIGKSQIKKLYRSM